MNIPIAKIIGYLLGILVPVLTYFWITSQSVLAYNFLIFYAWIYVPIVVVGLVFLFVFNTLYDGDEMNDATKTQHKDLLKMAERKSPFDSVWTKTTLTLLFISIIGLVSVGNLGLGLVYLLGLFANVLVIRVAYDLSKTYKKAYDERQRMKSGNENPKFYRNGSK